MTPTPTLRRALVCLPLVSLLALTACGSGGGGGGAEDAVTLRLSHQWPDVGVDGDGDHRALIAQRFAEEVSERSDGSIEVQVYPNASLVKATEQYSAMTNGSVDASVFPLSYAAGHVPAFDITLMPGLIRNHEQAEAWGTSTIGESVEEITEEHGVKILIWMWGSGIFATKGDPIVTPDDIRPGMVMRGAGGATEEVLEAAGAGITSLPSNEIYSALQTGVLDGVSTSPSSTISFNLQEQIDSYTASTENSFWFIANPLIISNESWDKLSPEQQDIVQSVSEELQPEAYAMASEDETEATAVLKESGVEVVEMDDAAFEQWQELSKETAWKSFAERVEDGQRLLDEAQSAGD